MEIWQTLDERKRSTHYGLSNPYTKNLVGEENKDNRLTNNTRIFGTIFALHLAMILLCQYMTIFA